MTDSPTKRRKTSPTTSFPIDAPGTPNQIPDLRQQQDVASKPTSSRRPSFASPTRASLARHNPELLKKPANEGGTSGKKNLNELFAKALAQTRPSIERGDEEGNIAPRGGGSQEVVTATRGLGGGLSAKLRRMSKSPVKSTAVEKNLDAPDLGGIVNPFAKKGGLRRSPTVSSQVGSQAASQEENPFARKTNVRRSPEPSQVVPASVEMGDVGEALRRPPLISQTNGGVGNAGPEPMPEEDAGPARRNALKRSPVPSQADTLSQEAISIEQTGLRRSPRLPSADAVIPESAPIRKAAFRRSPLSQADTMALEFSPVKKGGLRRSPPVIRPSVSMGHSEIQIEQRDDPGQVEKALRRSSIPETVFKSIETQIEKALRRSSIPETVFKSIETQIDVPEQFGTTPQGQPPSKALQPAPQLHEKFDEGPSQGASEKPLDAQKPTEEPPPAVSEHVETTKPNEPLKTAEKVRTTRLSSEAEKRKPVQPISKPQEPTIATKPLSEKENSRESSASQTQSTNLPKRKPVTKPPPSKAPSPEEIILKRHPDPPINKEPELPPTPTQLGLKDPVVTTPPAGIHNTPSKKARRIKALNAKNKSSPLKPRDERPAESQNASIEATPVPSLIPDSQISQPEKPIRRKSARFLVPVDPHAEKKKERDALLKQLQQLQADIAIGNQEAERLRSLQHSKKAPSNLKASEGLVDMLLRSTASEPTQSVKPAPTSIFKSIEAFLPFRSRRRQVTKPAILSILEKPLPSFLPTAIDDPLPYLQALSPLTYTSTIHLLPPTPSSPNDDKDPSQLQQHLISASHPSGLFFSRFSLTVNTSNFFTPSLEIIKLDPSSVSELGPFLHQMAEKKNLSVFCWAMARWAEVAIKRAGFWCAVESEFGSVEARNTSMQRLKSKGKRKHNENPDDEAVQQGWSRKQLLPMMGRTHFEVVSEANGVVLRVEWRLEFDWVGDCESVVEALVSLPGGWKQKDDRNSFVKIPEMFKRLVKEKGPLGAVRTTVGLLMDDS